MTETENTGAAPAATEREPVSILDTFDIPEAPSHPGDVKAEAEAQPQDSEDEEQAPETAEAEPDADADAPDADAPDVAEATDDADASDAATPESKPKKYVEADAVTRLRDGTEITIGELKKRADGEAIREREAQIEAERERIKTQSEQFTQAINAAMTAIESRLPPPPDPSMLQTDPIGYTMQKEERELAINELTRLHNAKLHHAQQVEAQARQEAQKRYEAEVARAKELVPELADPETARPLVERLRKAPDLYPNMPRDVPTRISAAWEIEVLRDAIAYRELQKKQAVVREKVKEVPPVQAAARRVSGNERRDASLREDLGKLKRTGDRRLGEDILSRFS